MANTSLEIFRAQVLNCRSLLAARKQLQRTINAALRRGDQPSCDAHTGLYALLFSAWAEANFVKLVHTPYGFTNAERIDIQKKRSVTDAWLEAIRLAMRHVPAHRSNFVPNARQRLQRLVARYVEEPAQIRNKIAHGQWTVALNNKATAVNPTATGLVQLVDVVQVDTWYETHSHLANIVETLIESPARSFMESFWRQITELEDFERGARQRSVAAKTSQLRRKHIRVSSQFTAAAQSGG